ncbi:MAG TPA: hypothetical protein VF354_05320 [Candidatus Methanoperedens sp.]
MFIPDIGHGFAASYTIIFWLSGAAGTMHVGAWEWADGGRRFALFVILSILFNAKDAKI